MINPFRPGSGIFPPYFAGRKRELDLFKKKLESGISAGFTQHMAIVSGWGAGKTSLLIKFKEIAKKKGCSVLPVQIYSMTSPRDFVELFVNSASFVIPPSKWQRFAKTTSGFGVSVLGSGFQVQKKQSYFEPQTALQHALKNIWENSDDVPLILITVDDMQLLTQTEQCLQIFRNSFTWATEQGFKYMLVVSGTPSLFERFQQMHAPLTRFFEPLILNLLDNKEVKGAVLKPLKKTKVRFSEEAIARIAELSEGNPFYVQLLSSHAFDHARNGKVDIKEFELAFISAINDISERMFNQLYKATSPTEKRVLDVMNRSRRPLRWGDIISKSKEANIKEGAARTATKRLVDVGLLKQVEEGKFGSCYTLRDNLFREYIKSRVSRVSRVS